MNSENRKTTERHVLMFELTNKLDLRIGEKIIALSNLSIYYTWKNINAITINLKYLHQDRVINLSYLMDPILIKYSRLF